MGENQPLKTLCDDRREGDGTKVIKGQSSTRFWNWHNGGCFEAGRDDGLGQREVKDVGENVCQYCTNPKHSAWNAIRASSFMCIHPAQGRAHITGGKCEWQVIRWEFRFDRRFCVFQIKASIKDVQIV